MLKRFSNSWREIRNLTDEALTKRIRSDNIDILVDLAGHTGNNRLTVFARRVAPIQITWLGYPMTTGLSQMDFRLTDAVADPPGLTEAFHSEILVHLQPCFLCYSPPKKIPSMSSMLVGYFSYDIIRYIEKIPDRCKDDLKIPDVRILRPKNLIIYDNLKKKIYLLLQLMTFHS